MMLSPMVWAARLMPLMLVGIVCYVTWVVVVVLCCMLVFWKRTPLEDLR